MVTELNPLPRWSKRALQGITFWIGHRRSLYDEYPLGESAFVAELCNLIFTHLDTRKYSLRCEVRYTELAGQAELPKRIPKLARADIVVFEKGASKDDTHMPRFIIEVKRGSARTSEINADLWRLAEIARLNPGCRGMLFVISESRRLTRFVTAEGASVLGPHVIPDHVGHFRVRRTYKAAHAFTNKDTAQYASVLEVYPQPRPRLKLKPRLRRRAGRKAGN